MASIQTGCRNTVTVTRVACQAAMASMSACTVTGRCLIGRTAGLCRELLCGATLPTGQQARVLCGATLSTGQQARVLDTVFCGHC